MQVRGRCCTTVQNYTAVLRKEPELNGHAALVQQQVQAEYQALADRYQSLAVDTRAQTHLQVGGFSHPVCHAEFVCVNRHALPFLQIACLVAATHKVLSAWIREDGRLVTILAEHVGQGASPLLRGMLRLTSWLTLDPFAVAVGRLKGLANDYGKAFDGALDKDEGCGHNCCVCVLQRDHRFALCTPQAGRAAAA